MAQILGLDIGIASVGWCVLDDEKHKITGLGVRIFTKAENPKDGASLALPRRLARSARRRLKRRRKRLDEIRSMMISDGLANSESEIDAIFAHVTEKQGSPYQLRAEGLDRRLTNEEWIRVLLHIAKHRGFQSNRKGVEKSNKEIGQLLEGIQDNESRLREKKYRTAGEMLWRDEKFALCKRNHGGSYSHTLSRSLLDQEVAALFAAQRKLSNHFASENFENKFRQAFKYQLPFASSGDILEKVGFCTFEKDKKRAPKMSYTAGYFILLTTLNHLRIFDCLSDGNFIERGLNSDERRALIQIAHKKDAIKYSDMRKALKLNDSSRFVGIPYQGSQPEEIAAAEKKTVKVMQGYHLMRKAFGKEAQAFWESLCRDIELLDAVARILTCEKSDDAIKGALEKLFLEKQVNLEAIKYLLPLSFQKFQHLSIEAMQKIIPGLEKGLTYDAACQEAGYNHSNVNNVQRQRFLPSLEEYALNCGEEIRNPVVTRALGQVRKVVNAVIRKYGALSQIHVELARDLAKPFDERKKIEKIQGENHAERERMVKDITTTFSNVFSPQNLPRGGDVLKYRLFREQNGVCAYSQIPFDRHRLFEENYAEIDHVIPYSRSFNDSMSNKVLVLCSQNRNKGKRTPWEFFGSDANRWDSFCDWVRVTIKNSQKQRNLLRTDFQESSSSDMKERNLNDTRYITRFAANWLRSSLLFAPDAPKNPVRTMAGRFTALLRGRWGLAKLKDREKNNLHHALDAAVIAATSQGMVTAVGEYEKKRELSKLKIELSGERHREPFPEPWPGFRFELKVLLSENPQEALKEIHLPETYSEEEKKNLKPIFVSRMPERKATGPAHADTVLSVRQDAHNRCACVKRISLQELKLEDLENIVGKERDWKLYEALKNRLEDFGNNPQKAFAEPFYKPAHDSQTAPIVRSIRVYDSTKSGVKVRGGLAANKPGSQIRVDVYRKNKKYYLVPHYVDDLARGILRTRAITQKKDQEDWDVIDENFEFLFSLFKNDLIKITEKNGKEITGYYITTDISGACIELKDHDASQNQRQRQRKGVKTVSLLEKYVVTPLGECYKVRREKRPEGKPLP